MEISLYHDHARLERDHWWFVARRAIVAQVLTSHLPPLADRRILDVGCGTGGMLPMLSGYGHVTGMEGEPLAVAHCHHAFSSFDVRRGEIPADVPSDGAFDVVTAFDVIEHIEDDVRALESLRSALRPQGTLVLTVPALPWLWSDHDRVNGHERRYTRRTLAAALSRSRFDLCHVSYFNTFLLPTVAATRLAQRLRDTPVEPRSDFTMPSSSLNSMLTRTMSSEARLVSRRGLPIGVSLVAVASRPADAVDASDASGGPR